MKKHFTTKVVFIAAVALGLTAQGCNATNSTLTTPSSSGLNTGTGTGTASQVQITWTAATGNPEGYQLEQSSDNITFAQVQALGSSATSATVSGLTPGKTYYFRLRSYNAAGESNYSSVYTAGIPSH